MSIWSDLGSTAYTSCSYYKMRPAMAREHTGHRQSPQTHCSHIVRSAVNLGAGKTACTASDGNTSFPNASLITSDDIRFNDVTNCPRTCRLDVIRYGQPDRPSDISGMSPVSDVALCTSKRLPRRYNMCTSIQL